MESLLNHHLARLLGLGSLSWAGHQVHVFLPINQLLNAKSSQDILTYLQAILSLLELLSF